MWVEEERETTLNRLKTRSSSKNNTRLSREPLARKAAVALTENIALLGSIHSKKGISV